MRTLQNLLRLCVPVALLLTSSAMVQAQLALATNADNTITIIGYTGSDGAVVIPDTTNGYPVTSIGLNAFNSCMTLTNVTLPSHLASLEVAAFWGCINLAGITIPDSVTNIGAGAFNSCFSFTNVAIPAGVTSIGEYAFFYCTNLSAINVDAANPAYCSAEGVLFNKDKTILMQFPFGKAGSYSIPSGVTSLADEAFGLDNYGWVEPDFSACAGLTDLFIPGSVTNIGAYAFCQCTGLVHVTLGNGISSIGDLAFYYSGLTDVTIPGSVTNFGIGAFAVCSSLTNVVFQDGVTGIGEIEFNFCPELASVTIPDSMTSIGDRAFWFCSALTNAIIPANVTNIGACAFSGCASLMNIDVSAGNLFYRSADGVLYDKNETTLIQFPGGRGGSYTVPDSVTNIGNYAFASYDPDGYYFQYMPSCVNLTNITIAANVAPSAPSLSVL